jgi:hypothetical protein
MTRPSCRLLTRRSASTRVSRDREVPAVVTGPGLVTAAGATEGAAGPGPPDMSRARGSSTTWYPRLTAPTPDWEAAREGGAELKGAGAAVVVGAASHTTCGKLGTGIPCHDSLLWATQSRTAHF